MLAAANFFSVEVWTAGGLTRFAVLFVIDLATRRVEIAGIVREPDSAWVVRAVANSSIQMQAASAGSGSSSMTATRGSLTRLRTRCQRPAPNRPPAAPFAQSQCLRGTLRADDQGILSRSADPRCRRSLRNVVHEFLKHYHHERNHQALSNRLLFRVERTARDDRRIACRARLGGC